MKISELGEEAFLRELPKRFPARSGDVVVGIGDDAAVLRFPEGERALLTTDSLIENVHFNRRTLPPRFLGRKAVAVNHNYTAAYARLGLMLSVTGRHEEAVDAFTQALELKPDSAILRNNLGFEMLYLERWDEAERQLREAIRLDARLVHAHINLGLLLGRTERYDEAVASFHQALPEPDAHYNLAGIYERRGEKQAALRHLSAYRTLIA